MTTGLKELRLSLASIRYRLAGICSNIMGYGQRRTVMHNYIIFESAHSHGTEKSTWEKNHESLCACGDPWKLCGLIRLDPVLFGYPLRLSSWSHSKLNPIELWTLFWILKTYFLTCLSEWVALFCILLLVLECYYSTFHYWKEISKNLV